MVIALYVKNILKLPNLFFTPVKLNTPGSEIFFFLSFFAQSKETADWKTHNLIAKLLFSRERKRWFENKQKKTLKFKFFNSTSTDWQLLTILTT